MANQINKTFNCSPFINGQQFPVSKETAEKTFTMLGDDWWKQVYDGKFHQFGKMVFDKGLHKGDEEPGFYDSALKASLFTKEHLCELMTVEVYCQSHKIACAHFKGKKNNTEMDSSNSGRFRSITDKGTKAGFHVKDLLFELGNDKSDRQRELIREYELFRNHFTFDEIKNNYEKCGENFVKFPNMITLPQIKEFERLVQLKFRKLNEYLEQLRQDPILGKALPRISLDDTDIRLDYAEPKLYHFSFEEVVAHLFFECNRSLSEIDGLLHKADSNDENTIEQLIAKKLALIADLYQKLEWLHPFPDGQGRTDLIVLGKLLTENGFTPAILDEPYISSAIDLEDWVDYLKEGMQKWREAATSKTLSL